MPLFFLISGFFTAMLWRKRGLAALLMQRFKRIFLPLVIGTFTIVPALWIAIIGASISGSSRSHERGDDSIWTAARAGDVQKIKEHLAHCEAPNQRDPALGATPLSMAAWQGHVEAVELLIANGAEVNARNRNGATPLHGAAFFGQAESVRVLIEHGADANARNRNGERAADTLRSGWPRTQVVAIMKGVQIDQRRAPAARKEVAQILQPFDPSSQSQAGTPARPEEHHAGASGDKPGKEILGGLLMLLVLFPVFHHLWFLWFLCWLVAAFAIYAKLADAFGWKPPEWLVISPLRYAWLVPLTILPQSTMGLLYPNFGPDTSTGLLPMPQLILYYAIFFFFGALYFDCDDTRGRVGRWWPVTLPVAVVVVFPVGYQMSMGGFGFGDEWLDLGLHRPVAIVLQVVYAWLMTFGLMGLFRNILGHENKAIRYLSDSSYWLYLAHLPLIIAGQAVVRSWQMPALGKAALVCAVTSALLLASYQLFVRYTPIGTLLNGRRTRPEQVVDAVSVEPTGTQS
jgi:hypothetical protein